MREKKGGAKPEGGSSSRSGLELNGIPLNFHSIMKEVQLLGIIPYLFFIQKNIVYINYNPN